MVDRQKKRPPTKKGSHRKIPRGLQGKAKGAAASQPKKFHLQEANQGNPADPATKPDAKFPWAVTGDTTFWQDIRRRFLEYDNDQHGSLEATWDPIFGMWYFSQGAGERSERVFRALAQKASTGLRGPRGLEPWEAWLDCMRCEWSGFKPDLSTTRCLSLSAEKLERDRKLGYPVPVVAGEMEKRTVRQRGEKPTTKTQWYFTNFGGGTIVHLFEASEHFCLELEARVATSGARRQRPAEEPIAIPSLEDLEKKPSYLQKEAAQIFCVSTRTIRGYIQQGKLHGAKKGRIAMDEKFKKLYMETHSGQD